MFTFSVAFTLQCPMSSGACGISSGDVGLEHAAPAQLLFYPCLQVPDDAEVSFVKLSVPWNTQCFALLPQSELRPSPVSVCLIFSFRGSLSLSFRGSLCLCLSLSLSHCLCLLPWYNHNGWLGVKHQVTYSLFLSLSLSVSVSLCLSVSISLCVSHSDTTVMVDWV